MRVFGGAAHGASARFGGVRLVGVALGAALALGAGSTAARAAILEQFQGGNLNQSNFVPPDMGGAVGSGYVVQLLNGVATIDSTTGTQVSQTSLNTFFSGITTGISDPRIIFDPSSQRWFASAITTPAPVGSVSNNILVAVSAGANPTGGFTTLSFPSANSSTFADFPTLGVNGAAVTIGTNDFSTSTGSYLNSSLYSIPKSSLTAATPTLANQSSFIQISSLGAAPQAATNAAGGGTSTTVLSVTTNQAGTQNFYTVSTVSGANAAGASLTSNGSVAQPFSNRLIAPTQPGGATYDPGDNRISSGAYQVGNNIYFANTVSTGTQDQIAWSILNTVTQTVTTGLIGMGGLDLTYGSISANANGTFVVTFNGSGSGQNITDYYAICSAITNTCAAPQTVYPSPASNYSNAPGGTNRWGDYSWTTVDPTNPNNFWLFQEYALTNSTWGTIITEVGTAVPEPATIAMLGFWLIGLGLARRRTGSA